MRGRREAGDALLIAALRQHGASMRWTESIDEMAARIDWLLGTTEGEQELIRIHENGRQLMADLSQDERF